MIKTLADLNKAGKKLWGTKDESFQCPYCQHAPFPSLEALNRHIGPTHPSKPLQSHDDTGKRAQDDSLSEEIKAFSLRNDLNEEAYQLIGEARGALAMGERISARSRLDRAKAAQKDKVKDFTTNPAEIEAAAKKAKAAGKSKEDFVAGYSGGAAETAARAWGKDSGIKTLADLNKAGRRFWRGPNLR